MGLGNNQQATLALLRAGLWEKETRLLPYGKIDYGEIRKLAVEQSIVGLVTAGLEHVFDAIVSKEEILHFIGATLQIEERNKAMNGFIRDLVDKMRRADIYTLLVKGQGVAQCYERPLWRIAGDIDFYLSKDNYEKAKALLMPLAQNIEPEDKTRLHFGVTIDGWVVELHGTMHTGISRNMNKISDEIHNSIFYGGSVRSWNNDGVQVFLPSPDNDVMIIFNHFISHFYGEGIGFRQICDWCRLLWTYKESLNLGLLESRIKEAGLMTEWKAFGAFVVEYLGMPEGAMPFYLKTSTYTKKAKKICKLLFETGSFGINKEYGNRRTASKVKYYLITFSVRMKEFARLTTIFPVNAPKFFVTYVFGRVKVVV